MVSNTAILFILLTLTVVYYFWRKRVRGNYPPGPTPIPFIGIIHKLGPTKHPFNVFRDWAEEYGPIMNVQLGMKNAVILSDYKLIKEAWNEPNFIGRPNNPAFNYFAGGKNGVLAADGQIWSEQRRFTLRHLRDFGFGKNSMESLIMDEVTELIESFKKEEGQPMSTNRRFSLAILNALWVILTGTRHNHDDTRVARILEEFFEQINKASASGIVFFFPFLIKLAPNLTGWTKLVEATDNQTNLLREIIAEHESSMTEGSPRDFTDSHLLETKKTTDPTSSFFKEMGHTQLLAIMGDLFAAGAETTSTTLSWAMLYLTSNLNVQKQFQEEIDRIIGKSRLPSLSDRPNMPYTEGVMLEVLRQSSIVALGLVHTTITDVKFHGYDIPKETYIMPNLYSIHHDPKIWGDPENFRPERFLSQDGKTVQKHEALMPFSTGKRQCLGETLARDEFFLFLTSIFQRFNVELGTSSKNVSTEPKIGFLLTPEEFEVVMKDRTN